MSDVSERTDKLGANFGDIQVRRKQEMHLLWQILWNSPTRRIESAPLDTLVDRCWIRPGDKVMHMSHEPADEPGRSREPHDADSRPYEERNCFFVIEIWVNEGSDKYRDQRWQGRITCGPATKREQITTVDDIEDFVRRYMRKMGIE